MFKKMWIDVYLSTKIIASEECIDFRSCALIIVDRIFITSSSSSYHVIHASFQNNNLQSKMNAFHNGCNKRHLSLQQWPHMNSPDLLPWRQHQPPTKRLLWTSHHSLLHHEGAFVHTAYQFITSSVCECTFDSFGCSINVTSHLVTVNAVS